MNFANWMAGLLRKSCSPALIEGTVNDELGKANGRPILCVWAAVISYIIHKIAYDNILYYVYKYISIQILYMVGWNPPCKTA